MSIRDKINSIIEERQQYKTLERESYMEERDIVNEQRIADRVDESIAKGKARAHNTGLPGPRVSPEAKEKAKNALGRLAKNMMSAAEKQHNANHNNNDESDSKPATITKRKSNHNNNDESDKTKTPSAEDRMKAFDDRMKQMMG